MVSICFPLRSLQFPFAYAHAQLTSVPFNQAWTMCRLHDASPGEFSALFSSDSPPGEPSPLQFQMSKFAHVIVLVCHFVFVSFYCIYIVCYWLAWESLSGVTYWLYFIWHLAVTHNHCSTTAGRSGCCSAAPSRLLQVSEIFLGYVVLAAPGMVSVLSVEASAVGHGLSSPAGDLFGRKRARELLSEADTCL